MAQEKDHFTDLDRHVQLLEKKVDELRASLTHWQQWYLEYSALKEEVENLPTGGPTPRKDLARIRRDFESEILTKKEVLEIFGKNDLKEVDQITSVLSRRLDYVEKNIETLQKLVETEENRLAAAVVIAHPDGGTDEETGLPITDIIEELDEDDNVVRSRLQTGSDAEPRVVEALKKLGIHDIPNTKADLQQTPAPSPSAPVEAAKQTAEPSSAVTPAQRPALNNTPNQESPKARKTVSFSDDTKEGHEAEQPTRSLDAGARRLQKLMETAKAFEAMDMSKAVIPEGESPEDSELRRQMLEYSMSEIGPVVAELELDEDYSDEDMEWNETEEEDDDEDSLGRSQHTVITDDYIKRMQELEKRLGVKSAFTVQRPEQTNRIPEEGIGRISVVGKASLPTESAQPPTASPREKEKKGVRFAPELDIAEEKNSQPAPKLAPRSPAPSTVTDIVEKVTSSATQEAEEEEEEFEAPPKRVSRFKKERKTGAPLSASSAATLPPGPHQLPAKFFNTTPSEPIMAPTGPEGQTLANTVVERTVSSQPKTPEDIDDDLLYQAAAVEYNRLRNRIIQKEGGFNKKEELEIVPLDEEEGGPQRVSKFKAARLARSQ
ncbi:Prefoldin subunit-domain-containing protein [Podospora appendiculata]|uniref:Prefoldin subunit-domain-containing protein n=1 Tax=Podospora appendiculata TaxID=314037 RepID=A0AAE1CHM7_9PEZI|nr:Prefoldin subunit-domain-containing protein [Podospora appendiculata]